MIARAFQPSRAVQVWLAAWVVPVSEPPILDAAVAVRGDRIVALGPAREVRGRLDAAGESGTAAFADLGDVVVMPAVVNAHCHLELSQHSD